MAIPRGKVQRRLADAQPPPVLSIGISAPIEEHSDDFRMPATQSHEKWSLTITNWGIWVQASSKKNPDCVSVAVTKESVQ